MLNKFNYKFLGTILVLLFVKNGISQDSLYYSSAFNQSGPDLKTELYNIIKGHVQFPYTASSTDVWDILKETDKDKTNPNNVILFYSNRSVNAAQEYNNRAGWSREHVWAKSRGDFGTSEGAGTDVHHLRACDVSVNSTRNNRNFDDCKSCIDVIDNGFKTGSRRDASLWTFEPPDNYKGDVARMIFYMTVRYEGVGGEPDLELTNTLLAKTDKSPLHSVTQTLLKWSLEDTVSVEERLRNEIIYKDYQKNRNPFIDYPELAEYLYGDSIGYVWKPEIVLSVEQKKKALFTIYPNPTKGQVTIEGEFTSLTVFNNAGQVLGLQANERTSLEGYPNGSYFFQITDNKGFTSVIKIYKEE